jgi:maltose-binding protein MalE
MRSGLLLALLALLVACSQQAEPDAAAVAPASPTEERDVTLIFWHAWPSPEQYILATLVDRYNQEHPDTRIVLQAMPLAALTNEVRVAGMVGSGPDIVLLQSHTIGDLAHEGVLLPINEHIFPEEERATLLPTALDAARVPDAEGNAQLYGLPLTFDTLALYYHRGYLETPPDTTASLLEQAHDLADAGSEPPVWGMAYALTLDKTSGYLAAAGGQVFDEQGRVVLGDEGREGTERWLHWLHDLQQDQRILAVSDSITVDSAMNARQAFITIDWAHALTNYRALWGDQLGVAALPLLSGTNQAPRPYVQSDVLCLNAHVVATREQQAALDFARYLLSDEAQQALLDAGKQPALLDVAFRSDMPEQDAARVFLAQARQGQPMPNRQMIHTIVHEELTRMQQAVLRGLLSPADAVTLADAELRRRIETPAAP